MIKVKSTVRINTQKIKRLDTAAVMALKLTADLLKTEITDKDVIPRDRGTLEDGLFVDDSQADQGKVSLVTSTPYARRLYYNPDGFVFHQSSWEDKKGKHDGNPNAKDHWYEDWQKGGKNADFVPETFRKNYKRLIDT